MGAEQQVPSLAAGPRAPNQQIAQRQHHGQTDQYGGYEHNRRRLEDREAMPEGQGRSAVAG